MRKLFEGEEGVAKLIIAANIFLIGSKLAVVLLTGSLGVIAVLLDSCFDFAGGIFAYFGIRKAREPPDDSHHYGHLKFNSLASLAQLSLIFITALFILYAAMGRFASPVPLTVTPFDLGLMGITIVVDILMATYLTRKAAQYSSMALEASAGNYTSDIFQNSAVLVGLFGMSTGFLLADPIAATLVALLMLRVVFNVGRKSVLELTDAGPSPATIAKIERLILSHKGVKSFHKLRARTFSGHIYIDVHVQMNPKLSLAKAHAIAETLKQKIFRELPEVKEVLIHEEPVEK
ncbi:MAG: cation diffusion facilitator family transporter [Candidatus Micrarchaeia archaeon]|jgi:cation diffusion facilitator family transporter